MVAHVATVAFLGLEARAVEVQVQIASGLPKFLVVGLPDKAVGESRERVHAALASIGLALPPKRITVNLSPADLPKEGSHYDLPIALGLLAAMGAVDSELLSTFLAVGELGLDGRVRGGRAIALVFRAFRAVRLIGFAGLPFVGGADFVLPNAAGLNTNFCAPIAASSIMPPSEETKTITPDW